MKKKKVGGLPWWLRLQRIHLQCRRPGFNPWVGKITWRREWLPIPVFLPGEFHGQRRRLAGYSPWGHKELVNTLQDLLEEKLLGVGTAHQIPMCSYVCQTLLQLGWSHMANKVNRTAICPYWTKVVKSQTLPPSSSPSLKALCSRQHFCKMEEGSTRLQPE